MEWNWWENKAAEKFCFPRLCGGDCCSGFDVGSTHRISASIQMSPKCQALFLVAVEAAAFSALRPAVLQISITEAHHQTRLINTLWEQGIYSEDKYGPFELSSVLTILELQSRQLLPPEIQNLFSIKNYWVYQMKEYLIFLNRTLSYSPFSGLHLCINFAKLETHSNNLQEMAQ